MDTFLAWQIGGLEIILIALAALLLFGKRLPELAKSLGKGVTEFKKGLSDVEDGIREPMKDSSGDSENDTPLEG